jgi:DNA end-binding protein Ku
MGEVVPREDMARGYEVAKGQYLIVEDEELDAVQIESTRMKSINSLRRTRSTSATFDSPYYIAPDAIRFILPMMSRMTAKASCPT